MNRRGFLAALLASLIARLAIGAAPERKLLCDLRIPHPGVEAEHKSGHLWMRAFSIDGNEHWHDLGALADITFDGRTNTFTVPHDLPAGANLHGPGTTSIDAQIEW